MANQTTEITHSRVPKESTTASWPGLYECPCCYRITPWTDGTVRELGDERDEFWCQVCGAEVPLERCRKVNSEDH